jgi:hypothetical protein
MATHRLPLQHTQLLLASELSGAWIEEQVRSPPELQANFGRSCLNPCASFLLPTVVARAAQQQVETYELTEENVEKVLDEVSKGSWYPTGLISKCSGILECVSTLRCAPT